MSKKQQVSRAKRRLSKVLATKKKYSEIDGIVFSTAFE